MAAPLNFDIAGRGLRIVGDDNLGAIRILKGDILQIVAAVRLNTIRTRDDELTEMAEQIILFGISDSILGIIIAVIGVLATLEVYTLLTAQYCPATRRNH